MYVVPLKAAAKGCTMAKFDADGRRSKMCLAQPTLFQRNLEYKLFSKDDMKDHPFNKKTEVQFYAYLGCLAPFPFGSPLPNLTRVDVHTSTYPLAFLL